VYSVTKSVISALIGIALDEKLIKDLDSLVGELLARHQAQLTGDMARVTPAVADDDVGRLPGRGAHSLPVWRRCGQLIVVVPEHRLVVAVASQPTKDCATDSQDVFALVSDVILTAFH
jgi:CubicO group peptidase (beta-lactamase class C family)